MPTKSIQQPTTSFKIISLAFLFSFVFSYQLFGQLTLKNDSYIYVNDDVLFSHYDLELSSANNYIYLRNEAQLIQSELSSSNEGLGQLSIYQEGTVHEYAYNYWCSPVGNVDLDTNTNTTYRIELLQDPLLTTTNPIDSQSAQFTNSHEGSTIPLTISRTWLYKFEAGVTYSNWDHIGDTEPMSPGLGFTMKGTSGSSSNQSYDFRGKPNNGTLSNTVLEGQFTLVGNPYPSALDALAFIHDTDNENAITGTLYFWE